MINQSKQILIQTDLIFLTILIFPGSESGKTNALLNLIKHQPQDIIKFIYMFESKYQLLINGREKLQIENLKNPKAFIDYSQTINNVYEDLEEYNPTKKRRLLIVFDDMIADMESNKKRKSFSH